MSYKPSTRKYNLTYRNMPGLEICAKGTTLGKLQEFSGADISLAEKNRKKAEELMRYFAGRIITWNIVHPEVEHSEDEPTDDNEPVCPVCGLSEDDPLPTTLKGMQCLEMSLVLSLMFGWVAAIASVSDPKEPNSSGGETSIPEELMSALADMQSPLK